ncbi:MAG: hypothetical protein M3421_09275, partial [Bacteroidota bacterium]|nr:hypothetical protein [Bacteroidota bacterium]
MYVSVLKIFYFLLCFLCSYKYAKGQSITEFSHPLNVCINQEINFKNTSTNVSRYEWDFCHEDLSSIPENSLSTIV